MQARERKIYQATLIGSIGNVLLLCFKFIAGVAGHSSAMLADAVHSLSDFITDLIMLVFVSISAKPKDESHDSGHGKYETFAAFIIGMALVAAATGIIYNGITKMAAWWQGEELEAPGMLALWAALLSIGVKEVLYQYTVHVGKAVESQALVANAWHHRSDALSSVGTAIGIGGAIALGNRWTVLDPLASIIVGLLLVRLAWKLLKGSVGELTEHALPSEQKQEIMNIVTSVPGVSMPHNLHTRRIGYCIAIDIHVRMDGDITLHEAHERASLIEQRIKERFGDHTYISVHMEPLK